MGVEGDKMFPFFSRFNDWLCREGVLRRLDSVGVVLEREVYEEEEHGGVEGSS